MTMAYSKAVSSDCVVTAYFVHRGTVMLGQDFTLSKALLQIRSHNSLYITDLIRLFTIQAETRDNKGLPTRFISALLNGEHNAQSIKTKHGLTSPL